MNSTEDSQYKREMEKLEIQKQLKNPVLRLVATSGGPDLLYSDKTSLTVRFSSLKSFEKRFKALCDKNSNKI